MTAEDTCKLLFCIHSGLSAILVDGEFAAWLEGKEMPYGAAREMEHMEGVLSLLAKLHKDDTDDRQILRDAGVI